MTTTATQFPTTQRANPFNAPAGGVVAPGAARPIGAVGGGAHTPHNALVSVGGEVIFVIVAVVIAGTGPRAANAMVALFALLFVLLLMNHFG